MTTSFNMSDLQNIYCQALYNASGLFLGDLKEYTYLMLSDSGFFRVHHTYLVNISHIKKYIKGEGGYIVLEGGHHVDVSKRKKESFLKQLPKI